MRWILACLLVLLVRSTSADEDGVDLLAFTMQDSDHSSLYLIDENGNNLQQIYACEAICRDPVWSGDGERIGLVDDNTLVVVTVEGEIVYSVPVDMGTYDYTARPAWTDDLRKAVYAARVDTANLLRIIDLAIEDVTEISELARGAFWPLWEPQGDGLVFARQSRIYHLDLATEELMQLSPENTRYDYPAFSPDGSRLLARHLGEPTGLTLLGDEPILLFEGIIDAPTWAPDGETIAINVWEDGDTSLVVISNDGEAITVADNAALNHIPSWTSDGTTIAYVGTDPDNPQFYALYVVPADGSRPSSQLIQQISRTAGPPSSPAWRPQPEETDDL